MYLLLHEAQVCSFKYMEYPDTTLHCGAMHTGDASLRGHVV